MNADVSKDLAELETRWRVRERKWARRLGHLGLGVEPLKEQLNGYRRTTGASRSSRASWRVRVPDTLHRLRPARHRVHRDLDPVRADDPLRVAGLRAAGGAAAYLADRARFEDEKKRLLDGGGPRDWGFWIADFGFSGPTKIGNPKSAIQNPKLRAILKAGPNAVGFCFVKIGVVSRN